MTGAETDGLRPAMASIDRALRDGVFVLEVTGEIDISNVTEVRDAAAELTNDAFGLVVDLSGARYIDSATMGVLFELNESLKNRLQAMRVIAPEGSPARRVLDLTGFPADRCCDSTLEDAMTAIRAEIASST